MSAASQTPLERIAAARAAIGEQPARAHDCYRIGRVKDHLNELRGKPQAGPLVRILERSEIGRIDEQYVQQDETADKHQCTSKRAGNLILGILVIAFLASVAGLIWPMENQRHEAALRMAATMLVYVALLASLLIAWRTGRRDPHGQWSECRGNAEYLRRHLFDAVLAVPEEARDGELPPWLLKLEYFRRYQLDVQRNYHIIRGAQNRQRARVAQVLIWPCLGITVVWVTLMALVFIGAFADSTTMPDWMPDRVEQGLASLLDIEQYRLDQNGLLWAIALAIFYGALHLRTMLDANLRNAARFARALDNLDYLAKGDSALVSELEQARLRAAEGDKGGGEGEAAVVVGADELALVRQLDGDQQIGG